MYPDLDDHPALSLFNELLAVPSPSGREEQVAQIVRSKLETWGYTPHTDGAGNVLVRIEGRQPEAPLCCLAAHMDEIGMVVTKIMGRLLAIPIATRFRPRSILLGDLVGCLVSVGIILLWSNSLIATWVGTFGMGLSMASVFPTTISLAERRMTITGRVTGWFFVGASAGAMLLPWLIGQLFDSIGPRVTMSILWIDLALALIVFGGLIVLSRPHPRSPRIVRFDKS